MSSYWLKRSARESAEGPFRGSDLKAMAAGGQLTGEELLSADRIKWVQAAKVKGLFPEPAVATMPAEQPAPAYAEEEPQQAYGVEEQPEAQSYQVETPPAYQPPQAPVPAMALTYATATAGRPRNVQWYLICAIVVLGLNVVMQIGQFAMPFAAMSSSRKVTSTRVTASGRLVTTTTTVPAAPNMAYLMGFVVGIILLGGGALGLLIYFTIWAYQVHREFQQFTNGAYPISPGKACGFCYIPFYNLFWICYMPFKLSEAVDWHLGNTHRETNPSTVMVFQILGLVIGWCIGGLNILFFALSMKNIQNGLNELWNRSTSQLAPHAI